MLWPLEGRGCIQACTGQGCVYPSMHWGGCVYLSMHWAGGCLPGGCLSRGAYWLGGVCPEDLPRGCRPRGVSVKHLPTHVNRMTDRCLWKYYLAVTSLWLVKIHSPVLQWSFPRVQSTDILVQELNPFVHACDEPRQEYSLDQNVLPCTYKTLVLDPERPINVVLLLLGCGSYTSFKGFHISLPGLNYCGRYIYKKITKTNK